MLYLCTRFKHEQSSSLTDKKMPPIYNYRHYILIVKTAFNKKFDEFQTIFKNKFLQISHLEIFSKIISKKLDTGHFLLYLCTRF
jgi:hypothetical protein